MNCDSKVCLKVNNRLCPVGLILVLINGCSDNDFTNREKDYFPLKTGWFWEYQVEEITYNPFSSPVLKNYFLRIEVADSILSSEGDYLYIWYRYIRNAINEDWQFDQTWSARKYAGYALVSEGNITYARLAFPVYVNRVWNGNLFNNNAEDYYRIISKSASGMDIPPGIDQEDVVEVEQENVFNNLTYRDVRKEWYANNVGLVKKESEVWTYRCSGGTCTGEIESGYSLRLTLMGFGRD